eukprot:TRINITY_DN1883_c0_g1_i11.p1 TRINITY_DN1883_c0_g1~~TRINITY_DN1883_c0_g1_i11.p1  ORF type:complete len:168 (-),score=11.60 TRINITY_DN1883_c0_g1_i11:55-558(-)
MMLMLDAPKYKPPIFSPYHFHLSSSFSFSSIFQSGHLSPLLLLLSLVFYLPPALSLAPHSLLLTLTPFFFVVLVSLWRTVQFSNDRILFTTSPHPSRLSLCMKGSRSHSSNALSPSPSPSPSPSISSSALVIPTHPLALLLPSPCASLPFCLAPNILIGGLQFLCSQ